jgi:diguanylate cyclase (GGDEF)-like protein
LIKIPRKLSYKYKDFVLALGKALPKRIAFAVIFFVLLYILLPVSLAVFLEHYLLKFLPLFYLVNIICVYYLFKSNAGKKYYLGLESEQLQEKINILADQNSKVTNSKSVLQDKISRYHSLKKIIESINRDLNLESIANSLTSIAFSLIANQKGTCILYFIDPQNNELSIVKTKKEDKKLVIKAKKGDIFDSWIIRHASPLFIEDAKKDFRFDLEKLRAQDMRLISSFIGAPLISDHKFLGILRLDNQLPGFYSQDDLRFLVTVCDLGSVALENGELFRKTQDLAIHDGLTSLYTKGYFLERLKEECKRSIRQKISLSLLMLDIDHFKDYNDKFGHTAGDIVLKSLSSSIAEFLKALGPIVSRFGGEEFCVILPRIDKKKAVGVAEDLRALIEKKNINLRGQETNITVSIGIAAFPDDASEEGDLILKSDRAMYEAKQKGRNRVISA